MFLRVYAVKRAHAQQQGARSKGQHREMSTTPMNSDAPADAKQPAQMHTPIQSGEALPTTPAELRELGNEVMRAGNTTKACHMYTLGIDMLGRSLMLDADGSAPAAELFALNASSGGELAKVSCWCCWWRWCSCW